MLSLIIFEKWSLLVLHREKKKTTLRANACFCLSGKGGWRIKDPARYVAPSVAQFPAFLWKLLWCLKLMPWQSSLFLPMQCKGSRWSNPTTIDGFLYINSLIREERMWKGTSQKTHLICHHISHHLTLKRTHHIILRSFVFVLTTVFRRLLIWLMPNLGLTRITVSTLESWRNSNNFLIVSRFYIITLLQGSQFESWNPNLHYFYEK